MKNRAIVFLFAFVAMVAMAKDIPQESGVFVRKMFSQDKSIDSIRNVVVINSSPLSEKNWRIDTVKVSIKTLKGDVKKFKMNIFTNGVYFTSMMFNIDGSRVEQNVKRDMKGVYDEASLVFKSSYEKQKKIVIFSDPQCPNCIDTVATIIKNIIADGRSSIYYYSLPLEKIHSNSKNISMVLATSFLLHPSERASTLIKLYSSREFLSPLTYSLDAIIEKFNSIVGEDASVTKSDVLKFGKKELNREVEISDKLSVVGTPTVFVDGLMQ